MIARIYRYENTLVAPLIFTSLILTGCQSPQGKFSLLSKSPLCNLMDLLKTAGDWSLGLSDAILFAKNDYKLLPESQQQIQTMAAKLASTGLTHARMDGHTDNYGEDSYNEGLSLKRANVVADAWAMGGQIPRSNLTTQGLGKKYPIASNKTAQGCADNRRVAVVITTP
ncbi:OmpA family protein [Escherichia coli]